MISRKRQMEPAIRDFDERNITDAVIERFHNNPDPRLKNIITDLVRHLRAFVREVDLRWQDHGESQSGSRRVLRRAGIRRAGGFLIPVCKSVEVRERAARGG